MLLFLIIIFAAALVAAAVLHGADRRWRAAGHTAEARLEAACLRQRGGVFDRRDLAGLPAPVQRYFRAVMTDGQPLVTGVRLMQSGRFNLNEAKPRWKPFTATQRVIVRRPGFVWDARIALAPGVEVRVRDAYGAGEGSLEASLFGLVPVATLRGTRALAEGELMRFLAEAAWYPTALLPAEGVRWEAVDDRSARATLGDGDIAVTLLFHFDAAGLIDIVRAAARSRTVGATVTSLPWECRLWSYAARAGMRVPLEGEAAWVFPEGNRPYWRGKIATVDYDFGDRDESPGRAARDAP